MRTTLVGCLVMLSVVSARAETRGPDSFYTPEKLTAMSTLVFDGTVLEIETVEGRDVSFPIKAKVDTVLKGTLKEKELSFAHKSPGKFVILEVEYNPPKLSQRGRFYLQNQHGTLVLIGYIRKAEQKVPGKGK